MADSYTIVNNEGDIRTASNPGEATLLNPSEGGGKSTFSDLKPLAYSATGGLISYVLAKYLLGNDDDDDEDQGVKKPKWKKTLKGIVPFLAAAGGAYGGYKLSGRGSKLFGRKGEIAIKNNEDGSTSAVDVNDLDKQKGNYAGALAGGVVGGAGAGRTVLNFRHGTALKAQASLDALKSLKNASLSRAKANEKKGILDDLKKQLDENPSNGKIKAKYMAAEVEYNRLNAEAARIESNARRSLAEALRRDGKGFSNKLNAAKIGPKSEAKIMNDLANDSLRLYPTTLRGKMIRPFAKNWGKGIGRLGGWKFTGPASLLALLGSAYAGYGDFSKNSDLERIKAILDKAGHQVQE